MEESHLSADGFTIGVFSRCMKGERIRYQQTGEFHFLTFSCYRRRPYLSTVAAMELFEDALERVRCRYLFVIGGYVVMPEHVHLLVNEPRRGLLSRTVLNLIKFGMRKGPSAKYEGPRLSIWGLCILGIRGTGCRLRNLIHNSISALAGQVLRSSTSGGQGS